MKARQYVFLFLGLCGVAARPVPEKIESLDQLRKAAVDVEVALVDYTVPASAQDAERALSDRYFNKPQEGRFSGVTTSDWQKKWDLMAAVLVEKAEKQKLDSKSLEACLKALNRGRTEETMMCVLPPRFTWISSKEKPEEKAKRESEEQATYDAAMKDRKEHPDKWESPEDAIPVAAYLAKHAGGLCWVVVCKWEDDAPDASMGHIRIWALDSVTHKTVAYVTCD